MHHNLTDQYFHYQIDFQDKISSELTSLRIISHQICNLQQFLIFSFKLDSLFVYFVGCAPCLGKVIFGGIRVMRIIFQKVILFFNISTVFIDLADVSEK